MIVTHNSHFNHVTIPALLLQLMILNVEDQDFRDMLFDYRTTQPGVRYAGIALGHRLQYSAMPQRMSPHSTLASTSDQQVCQMRNSQPWSMAAHNLQAAEHHTSCAKCTT